LKGSRDLQDDVGGKGDSSREVSHLKVSLPERPKGNEMLPHGHRTRDNDRLRRGTTLSEEGGRHPFEHLQEEIMHVPMVAGRPSYMEGSRHVKRSLENTRGPGPTYTYM